MRRLRNLSELKHSMDNIIVRFVNLEAALNSALAMRPVRAHIIVMVSNLMGTALDQAQALMVIIVMFLSLMGTAPDLAQAMMVAGGQVEREGLEGEKLMIQGMERWKL